jgi:biofilm PGA synthesis N-glycosyltransferase PgaC
MTLDDIMELIRPISAVTKSQVARVCVVIPAFNEELLLGRCIQSVLTAGVGAEHIYVVDDCSTDRTGDVVREFAGVNLLTNTEKHGKLGGLRRAIDACALVERYTYLALLDADSHVAPDYFVEVLATFSADERNVLVCGAPVSERHNWLTAYRAFEYAVTLRAYRQGQHALGVITVAPGCASTYATRILNSLDWSGQTLVEDMDVTIQIHRRHLGAVAFTPHAVAYTQDPQTVRQYIGQLTRWYCGTWQVMRLRRLLRGGQAIDAEFGLLVGEGLIYALLAAALPVFAYFRPSAVTSLLLLDQAIWLALAVTFAISLRRFDILVSFPTFFFIRALNCGVFLLTLWTEVVLRRTRREWFSVSRYRVHAATPEINSCAV